MATATSTGTASPVPPVPQVAQQKVLRSAGLSMLSPVSPGTARASNGAIGGSVAGQPCTKPRVALDAELFISEPSARQKPEALDLHTDAPKTSESSPVSPGSSMSLSPGSTSVTSVRRSMTDTADDKVVARRVTTQRVRKLTIDTKITGMLGGSGSASPGHLLNKPHPAEEAFTPGTVAAVWGESTDMDLFHPFFSGKVMNFDNNEGFSEMPHAIGVHCQRGQKPSFPNQDDFFILQRQEWLLVGVLDGHGAYGHEVSHLAQENLPVELCIAMFVKGLKWGPAAQEAFQAVKETLREKLGQKAYCSGTTATTAMIRQDKPGGPFKLTAAFVGDSSIVYAKRAPGATTWEVTQLGTNHKPDREDEFQRISSCGGCVTLGDGKKVPARLVSASGGLAMSRSLGDLDAEKLGLIAVPEVPKEIVLEDKMEHLLLLCSDGVWDVFDPPTAVQVVGKFSHDDSQRAAERLVSKAQLRWQEQESGREMGVIDDITCIVIRLGAGVSTGAAS